MDWPTSAIQVAAIRDVLRSRVRRAEEAADAFASAFARPPADWHARVMDAAAQLRGTMARDAARELVRAWDDGRPAGVPPAEVALAPWAQPGPAPVWSPTDIRDRAETLRNSHDLPRVRAAQLAERWARQSGPAAREWHAAATALLRWAARASPSPSTVRTNWWPALILVGLLLWRRR